jgi:hypothetical protein
MFMLSGMDAPVTIGTGLLIDPKLSTRKSLGSSPRHLGNQTKKETLLPALLAAVLHQHSTTQSLPCRVSC